MKFLSVCSGIEAASVAWKPLGWEVAGFSEIEKFPSAVLAHHYPDVPNFGDIDKFQEWPVGAIDLLVGGTPCQSFSVAGLRKGLADPRGNLLLVYLAIAAKHRPSWLVWENVPGVLSSNCGRDFGTFLGALVELGYGFAYRVLDAQYFGVPQRRRRVFVVGHLGDWRRAAAVLLERNSLRRNPAPRREKGQGTTAAIAPSLTASGRGVERTGDTRGQDPVVACVATREGSSQDYESTTMIAHALRGEGFDASEDGTGRGTPLVLAFDTTQCTSPIPQYGDPCHTLSKGSHAPAIGFLADDYKTGSFVECNESRPLTTSADRTRAAPIVAFDMRGREGGAQMEGPHDTANIRAASGGSSRSFVCANAVRRLTPRECARLQGFPDDYLDIQYRGKPAADGPKYKALGNSMAVPVMRWIGERITSVDAIGTMREAA